MTTVIRYSDLEATWSKCWVTVFI